MKLKNSIFDQQESDLLTYGGFDPEYFKQDLPEPEPEQVKEKRLVAGRISDTTSISTEI